MEFVAPAADAGFANHKAHGTEAQRRLLSRAIGFCAQRRGAVDVGAHIGTWTVELARYFSSVFAFEPQQENFVCLEKNVCAVRREGHEVRVHQVALSHRPGSCSMTQHGTNSGCWYAAPGKESWMLTLDRFELENVDLIKIDVEGMEGKVLLGATKTLSTSHPVVVFEDNGLGQKLYGADWIDPKSVLADFGYTRAVRLHKDEIWSFA